MNWNELIQKMQDLYLQQAGIEAVKAWRWLCIGLYVVLPIACITIGVWITSLIRDWDDDVKFFSAFAGFIFLVLSLVMMLSNWNLYLEPTERPELWALRQALQYIRP